MRKQIVFMHQTYPGQFRPISEFILRNYDADVSFFSQFLNKPVLANMKHFLYKPALTGHEATPYFFSRYFEQEAASMHGLYLALQESKINPDVLVGHVGFGNMGLLHVDYSKIPRIGFFELFYDVFGPNADERPDYPVPKPNRMRIPLRNATQLVELEYCTKGYCPTAFQRSTYPAAYREKLKVLFDGIDVDFYRPGGVSRETELKRTWPLGSKLVTYVSRGLEAARGFDIFMEVAHLISQKRQDVHFVIAGKPTTNYGSEMINIKESSLKDYVLKKGDYDLNRFHFLDWISEAALRDLFRLSDCHFYWTIPFVLSWSFFQAMASGCILLASNSAPVRDVLSHESTGLLFEPYSRSEIAEMILEILDCPQKFEYLRENARQEIVDHYSYQICLPELADFYLSG